MRAERAQRAEPGNVTALGTEGALGWTCHLTEPIYVGAGQAALRTSRPGKRFSSGRGSPKMSRLRRAPRSGPGPRRHRGVPIASRWRLCGSAIGWTRPGQESPILFGHTGNHERPWPVLESPGCLAAYGGPVFRSGKNFLKAPAAETPPSSPFLSFRASSLRSSKTVCQGGSARSAGNSADPGDSWGTPPARASPPCRLDQGID
jgi:hypothetical protein